MRETTIINGRVIFRRRSPEDGGETATVMVRGQLVVVDNRWVVQYNPALLLRYRCHLNVSPVLDSERAEGYIGGYMTKTMGPGGGTSDRTGARLVGGESGRDDITEYQTHRAICAVSAVSRIMGNPVSAMWPAVERLHLHDEGGQFVSFADQADVPLDDVIESVEQQGTMLTDYFAACDENREGLNGARARDLTYSEMIQYFRWEATTRRWVARHRDRDDCAPPSRHAQQPRALLLAHAAALRARPHLF